MDAVRRKLNQFVGQLAGNSRLKVSVNALFEALVG
jgi:hypothetical protein